ncbi:SpoIID/LytB domain-containing protein [Alicyclobacillaceae bacterium I2511]|nr:SpoIID/LytB domain-containing protein [Alicyclobacillaceae bacterium I2511]
MSAVMALVTGYCRVRNTGCPGPPFDMIEILGNRTHISRPSGIGVVGTGLSCVPLKGVLELKWIPTIVILRSKASHSKGHTPAHNSIVHRDHGRQWLSQQLKPSFLGALRRLQHGSGQTVERVGRGVVVPGLEGLDALLQRMDWRGWTALSLVGAWAVLVALPAGVAVLRHGGVSPETASAWLNSADEKTDIRVYRVQMGQVVTLPLGDYLENVLAAQMSPTAPLSALEATAVAARTYAVHAMTTSAATFARQYGADVTDSPLLDLPWLNTAQQMQHFGNQQAWAMLRYQQAIAATNGQVLTYAGKPILAFTFALSPGHTRTAAAALGRPLPYLTAVACPADAKVAKPQQITLTAARVAELLKLPVANFQPDKMHRTVAADGFVEAVTVLGHTWNGAQFATLLNLPSADFQFQVKGSQLTFTTWGLGSDLGMSLHEASALAAQGKSWSAILATFYPGTQLTSETSLLPNNNRGQSSTLTAIHSN